MLRKRWCQRQRFAFKVRGDQLARQHRQADAPRPHARTNVQARPAFGIERRHTACPRRRNGLTVITVGDIARGKDAVHTGVRAERLSVNEIALVVRLDLPGEKLFDLYCEHATAEQYHAEIKSELDLERMPSGAFKTR